MKKKIKLKGSTGVVEAIAKAKGIQYEKTDYHNFTKRNTPQEIRRHLNVGDIWMNKIQCNKCKDIIMSVNRHDMQYCKCGAVFIDGGSWYGRYGGMDLDDVINLSEPFDDVR